MPALMALHEEYADRGLTIVGVSNESPALLKKFIEDFEVKFPIVRSQDAITAYRLKGYPTYALVGADGKLVCDTGHGVPSKETIEEALRDVVLVPAAPSSRVAPVGKSLEKRRYREVATKLAALSQANLDDAEREYVDALRTMYEQRVAWASSEIKELAEGPDYLKAETTLKEISEDFEGLPPGAEADAELDRFKRDDTIKREITAMKSFEKLRKRYPLSKSSSRNKLVPALQRLARKYDGTHAAEKARELRGQLRAR